MSELRPSFQERDRYLDLLSTAYADGRLDEAEFEARSNGVLAAVTHSDAMAQFQGLPQPTIVPVTPTHSSLQQGPPQAFQPLPEVHRGASSGGMGRRVVLGVGAAVVGLGVLGVISFAGPTVSDSTTGLAEPMMPGEFSMSVIFVDGLAEAMAQLADLGFDGVADLTINLEEIRGSATRERAPGEVTDFSFRPGGELVTSGQRADGSAGIALAEAERWVARAVESAGAVAGGEVVDLEMMLPDGVPFGHVWLANGAELGVAEIDASGEVLSFEVVDQ